jgi:hypothetical protein
MSLGVRSPNDRSDFQHDRIRAVEHARPPQVVERWDRRNLEVHFLERGSVATLIVRGRDVVGLRGPVFIGTSPERAHQLLALAQMNLAYRARTWSHDLGRPDS